MTIRAYAVIRCDVALAGTVGAGLRHVDVAHAKILAYDQNASVT